MIFRLDRNKVLFYISAAIVVMIFVGAAAALVHYLPSAPGLGEMAEWVSAWRRHAGLPVQESGKQARSTVDPEEAYYAGITSLCLWSLSDYPPDVAYAECAEFVGKAQAAGWYEGWREAAGGDQVRP